MGGLAPGPLGLENPRTHSHNLGGVCVYMCRGEKLIEKDLNIYTVDMKMGERRGWSRAGWVPADETDVGPYWKASAQCTRTPSSTPDIWA